MAPYIIYLQVILVMKMTSFQKSIGKQRTEQNEQQSYNVRFDYSDTYLENEDLDYQLEMHEDELNRQQYRISVETDELLKKTKQNADEILQLKNAVKNRDPYESSNKVSKSAGLIRRQSSKQFDTSTSADDDTITRQTSDTSNDAGALDETEIEDNTDGVDNTCNSKPLNTLTMFLLSLRTMKRKFPPVKKQDTIKRSANIDDVHPKLKVGQHVGQTNSQSTTGQKAVLPKRPSSYHAGDIRSRESSRMRHGVDKMVDSQYGIRVKKDHTRSRRKLEEISKLDQDSKYGYVNKYEERRKMLLASCKDTKTLDERIKLFLKDVDEFKVISSVENSLEKVLMRAKSAHHSRTNTFAW